MTIELITDILDAFAENFVLIVGICIALVAAWHLRKKFKPTRAQKQHKWNQQQSYRDLTRLRAIDPLENPGRCINWLRKVNAYRFEEMILSELDRRKLKIERNESYSGDGGIDGRFYLNDALWLVQAKRYSGFVKGDHIREFEQICEQHGAQGLFVHTGKTPKNLSHFKRQIGCVRIISGEELMKFFAGKPVSLTVKKVVQPAQDFETIDPIARGAPQTANSAWMREPA